MTRTRNGKHTEQHDPHWVEWLAGILSGILVVALIGWMTFEALTRTDTAPDLAVTVLGTQRTAAGFRVDFEIANRATVTAAAVSVVGTLGENSGTLEEATVTFDYVPAQSRTTGAVIFSNDPAGRTLVIRATGYTDP